MIITRSVKLVVRPYDFESITLEGSVSHDFGELSAAHEEADAIAMLQRVLDAAMKDDVNEAVANVPESTTSFIDTWKQEEYQ